MAAIAAQKQPDSKISIYLNIFLTYNQRMKKRIYLLLALGVLAACEQRTETAAPEASPTAAPSSETTSTSSAATEAPATESSGTIASPSP